MKGKAINRTSFLYMLLLSLLAALFLLCFCSARTQAAPSQNIKKAKVTIKYSKTVCTGKAKRPAVTVKVKKKTLKKGKDYTVQYKNNKKVGKAVVVIKGKGAYTGTVKKTFRIVPKGTKITSVAPNVNSILVKWKKQGTQTGGYQICCSTDAKFKTNKRTVSVSGKTNTEQWVSRLKEDTTYYVRVRTFKRVKNKTYSSAWSKTKTVKTVPDGNDPYRKYAAPSEAERALATSNAKIGLQILKEKLAEKGAVNALISPISLYEDLAMTTNAAGGNTLEELETYLGGNISDVNKCVVGFNGNLPSSLHVANSIWVNDMYGALAPAFLKTAKETYKAEAESVPYNNKDTVNRINAWVNKNTNGMIPTLIDSLSPDEVMHLINAVAFESQWKTPYETEDIRENQTFFGAQGKETCVMLQSKEAELLELKDAEGKILAEGFLKPYGDGKTAFLGLLPSEGLSPKDILQELSGEAYTAMYQNKAVYQGGTLYAGIPEFKLDDETELEDYMKKAGVQEAFTGSADFSGMLASGEPVHIDKVLQKTHIEVDRNGTKAAAATDIGMKAGSAPTTGNRYLYLNKPFLYMIVDYHTGLPLFMGVQNQLK